MSGKNKGSEDSKPEYPAPGSEWTPALAEDGMDYRLNKGHYSAWVTVGPVSVWIHDDLSEVRVELYAVGAETGDALDSAVADKDKAQSISDKAAAANRAAAIDRWAPNALTRREARTYKRRKSERSGNGSTEPHKED